MKTIKLLFVEDDEALAFMVTGSLELTGRYEIHSALNGDDGLSLYREIHPDIIVADIEMPGISGFELVKQIREMDNSALIIIASARSAPKDWIEGFSVGADNFIRKPYLPEELDVQIMALLRRINRAEHNKPAVSHKLSFGHFRLDAQLRTLETSEGEVRCRLTERELQILKKLLERRGEVVMRNELLSLFWRENDFYSARSLDVFMSKIRKYLREDSSIEIQTIRGEGFRLIVGFDLTP